MSKLRIALALASAGALAIAATGCAPGSGAKSGKGSINIGIKYDQPGLGLKEGITYTGFDVEVATYVAKELGYAEGDINFIETPSAQRESMIEGGQVKLIFATYSITDARKQKVSFAGPYLVAGQNLLVREDSPIASKADLQGRKLCSVAGSSPAKKIKDEYPDVALLEQDTYSKCVSALKSGRLDAVTTDDAILAGFAAQPQYKGRFRLAGDSFTKELYGVGLKKGDVETCTAVNKALTKMIDTGAWQAALDKTLGKAGYQPRPDSNPPKLGECA